MRNVSFEDYNNRREKHKVDLLNIKDNLDKEKSAGLLNRDDKKRRLLYKLAQKNKLFKKVDKRKYKINN